MYVGFASTTLAGSNGPFTVTRSSYRPTLTGFIRSDTTINTRRIWFALTSASLSLQAVTGPASSTTNFVGIALDTGVSTVWRCCSGDGTNYSCSDITGTSLVASTEYTLTVDYSVAGTLTCSVQAGTGSVISVAKTTNLPTAAVDLGPQITVAPLDGANKNLFIARAVLEQN
jgi:hypothetical protein